ncbi:MAG: PAS domain S-box protein, partial [Pseudonocardiaceae bacterium]
MAGARTVDASSPSKRRHVIPEPPASSGSPTRAILESTHEAFVSMDAGGFIVDWNLQAELTFGWSREEAVGRVLSDTIIPPRYRERHLRGLARFLDTGEGPMLNHRFEIEALHQDGRELPIEITIAPLWTGESYVFHAFLHDISERRRHAQYLAAQHATTAVLAEAETVEDAIPRLLEALGAEMGWEFGAYWAPDQASALHCEETWTVPDLDLAPFELATRRLTLDPGVGLP